MEPLRAQERVVDFDVIAIERMSVAIGLYPGADGCGNRARHVVVNHGNILQLAIVTLGPDSSIGAGLNQVYGEANSGLRSTYAALDRVCDAESLGQSAWIPEVVLEMMGRLGRNHEERAEAGELGDDVLGDAFGEVLLPRVLTEIPERKNSD